MSSSFVMFFPGDKSEATSFQADVWSEMFVSVFRTMSRKQNGHHARCLEDVYLTDIELRADPIRLFLLLFTCADIVA